MYKTETLFPNYSFQPQLGKRVSVLYIWVYAYKCVWKTTGNYVRKEAVITWDPHEEDSNHSITDAHVLIASVYAMLWSL